LVDALRTFAFPHASDDLLGDIGTIVRFGVPPYRIEVIQQISGVEFEEAWANRVEWRDGGIRIPVIGLAELKKNNAASNRSQDRAGLDHLPEN
jgi:hypothetical protein